MAVIRGTAHSQAEWLSALFRLLPVGQIWEVEMMNAQGELYREISLYAQSLAELEHELLCQMGETSPLTATKTLAKWCASSNVSYDDSQPMHSRINVVIKILGSYASTLGGLKGIAQLIGYSCRLEVGPCTPGRQPDEPGQQIKRTLWLHSDSNLFAALLADVDAQHLALCGEMLCGEHLWQDDQCIVDTLRKQHESVSVEINLLRNLLPAHLAVSVRIE